MSHGPTVVLFSLCQLGSDWHDVDTNECLYTSHGESESAFALLLAHVRASPSQSRLAVEEGLNMLPHSETVVTTPTGKQSSKPDYK